MGAVAIKESYIDTLRVFGEVGKLLNEAVEEYLIDRIIERRLFGISQGKATCSGTPIRQIGDSPRGRGKGVGIEL